MLMVVSVFFGEMIVMVLSGVMFRRCVSLMFSRMVVLLFMRGLRLSLWSCEWRFFCMVVVFRFILWMRLLCVLFDGFVNSVCCRMNGVVECMLVIFFIWLVMVFVLVSLLLLFWNMSRCGLVEMMWLWMLFWNLVMIVRIMMSVVMLRNMLFMLI